MWTRCPREALPVWVHEGDVVRMSRTATRNRRRWGAISAHLRRTVAGVRVAALGGGLVRVACRLSYRLKNMHGEKRTLRRKLILATHLSFSFDAMQSLEARHAFHPNWSWQSRPVPSARTPDQENDR